MTNNDKKLLSQMVKAGKFNWEIAELLREKTKLDTQKMIKSMGSKYCLHPSNSPVKDIYGIQG